jgi:hypothetical protein
MNNDPIVYYVITTHGSIPGYYENNEFNPVYFHIPDELNYVNKITQAPLGIYNIGNEPNDMNIKNEISTMIEDTYNQKIFGKELANKINELNSVLISRAQYNEYGNIGKRLGSVKNLNEYQKGALELYRNIRKEFHSIDNKQSDKFIDKKYLVNYKTDGKYRNIYVIYQNGGELRMNDKILDLYFVNKQFTRSTTIYGINLSELLNFSIEKGYKNVVIIDLSCESCYDFNTNKEIDIQSRSMRQYRNESKRQKLWGGRKKRIKKTKKRKYKKNK